MLWSRGYDVLGSLQLGSRVRVRGKWFGGRAGKQVNLLAGYVLGRSSNGGYAAAL